MDFARNASSTALTQVARGVLGLGLGILLNRWLSEADRGTYAVIATLAIFGDQLSQLGMRFAVIYRMSQPGVSRTRAVGAALQWTLAAFAVLALLAAVFVDPLRERFLAGGERFFVWVALALTAADLFAGLSDAVARGLDRFDLRNANQMSIAFVSLAATWAALVVFRSGLEGALLATAVVRLAVLLVFGGLTLRESGIDLSIEPDELRESLRFGLKGHAQNLLARLHERLDVMLMAALQVDPAQIAVYATAVIVIDRLRVVPEAVGAALYPKLAVAPPAETGPYTARVTRHLVFWIAVSGVALAGVAPFLVPLLFGEPYAASVLPLVVLLPATLALNVRAMVSNYFVAVGKPGFNAKVQALAVAVNFAANLWAIPRYGILGAAFVSLFSYSVEAAATVAVFMGQTRCGLRETLVVGAKDFASYAGLARRLGRRPGGAAG